MDLMEVSQGTNMPPYTALPPGDRTTLVTVDIVVLVLYFLLILAVGFWVSIGEGQAFVTVPVTVICGMLLWEIIA